MQLTVTNQVHVIEPQDEAMEAFRKQFRWVAGCKVSEDGMVMTYYFVSMSAAHSCLKCAYRIIIANNLPLTASARSVLKGKEVCMVQLRIVYNPKQ